MRARFKLLPYLLIFIFCSIQMQVYGQDVQKSGLELSDSIYSFLKKNGYSPYNHTLVTSGENAFPYNVSITFKSNETRLSHENLVIVFFQDDVIKRQDMIKKLLASLSEKEYDFDLTVLFAYGEKQKIEKQDMIFGTQVFIDSLSSNLGYTAMVFNIEGEKYNIETSSSGTSSPPWLIQNACNSLVEASHGKELPRFFLSQISNYKFFTNRILSAFFDNEIPAIIMNMESGQEDSGDIILNTIEKFSRIRNHSWEHHFMVIKLFGRYRKISEILILRIILPTILVWIFFICFLFFVNIRMKKHAWQTTKSIWYLIPGTYLLIIAGFYLGRYVSRDIFLFASDAAKIYGQLITQIIISLIITQIFFLFILFINYKFEEKSIDYLLITCCFINQSLFILADISLCPIFIIICLLSLIALTIKNNILHVIIFVLMILPFIPYGNDVIRTSDTRLLRQFIVSNELINFILPLALYPSFIIMFRSLTAVRSRSKKMLPLIITSLSFFFAVSAFLIILGTVRTKQINSRQYASPKIVLSQLGTEVIEIDYEDQHIFGDIVRTLNIKLNEKCVICDVQINTQRRNPILYTDNDYKTISDNSVRFSIPDYPPQSMTFSYGAAAVPCKILVSAVLPPENTENSSEYRFITKSIQIGEMQ